MMKLWLSIRTFPSKTLKKPSIVKVIDNICKKETFFKLNDKSNNLFLIIYIKI